jgi:glyoxylase-like metal-dependent hydrolase (beta-lactamase superfamily II)
MKRIEWVSDNLGYFDAPTTSAVIRLDENKVCVVDPGINFESGRKLNAALKREGLAPVAIINTHSHADHYGGNSYFLKRENVEVYFPAGESGIARFPIWEPFYLYGGTPPKEMKVPFLMPEATSISREILPGKLKILDCEINIIDLSGHSLFQIGIEIDGFLYAADSLFSPELWKKHVFTYFADYASSLEKMKQIKEMKLKGLILSHRGFYDNVTEVADFNILKLKDLYMKVLNEICSLSTTDEILMRIAEKSGVNFDSLPSYFLARQTVLSMLTYAGKTGELESVITEKGLSWRKV